MACVLGLIPARGGSKGIPDKNITPLHGKPLIAWTIEAARSVQGLDHLVVSTDCSEIASVSQSCGVAVERLRPAELSGDTAKSIDVMIYEVERFERERNKRVEALVLLQPTAPLRTARDIEESIRRYHESGLPSLVSVYDALGVHPSIMYTKKEGALVPLMQENQGIRRQDMDAVYIRNGAIYITQRDFLLREKKAVADPTAFYEMPSRRSLNIDRPEDLALAALLMKDESLIAS